MKHWLVMMLLGVLLSDVSLAQQACTLGDTKWITAIDKLSVTAQWDQDAEDSAVWNPPDGWALVDHRVDVESSNNGGRSVSIIAGGSNFTSQENLQKAFQHLLDVTGAYTDEKGEAKVIFYQAEGLGHQLMINPGNEATQGGKTGPFAIDAVYFYQWKIFFSFAWRTNTSTHRITCF